MRSDVHVRYDEAKARLDVARAEHRRLLAVARRAEEVWDGTKQGWASILAARDAAGRAELSERTAARDEQSARAASEAALREEASRELEPLLERVSEEAFESRLAPVLADLARLVDLFPAVLAGLRGVVAEHNADVDRASQLARAAGVPFTGDRANVERATYLAQRCAAVAIERRSGRLLVKGDLQQKHTEHLAAHGIWLAAPRHAGLGANGWDAEGPREARLFEEAIARTFSNDGDERLEAAGVQ